MRATGTAQNPGQRGIFANIRRSEYRILEKIPL
jgi:hypothetical protein